MTSNTNKFDAYTMVTDRIVSLMESGIIPWARPWSSTSVGAWSRSTGNMYSLVNQMLLADPEKEYSNMDELLADVSGEWLTFKQALDLGGCVRKGESGRKVVFFKIHEKKTGELDDEGNEKVDRFPVLRCYTVFRIDQCDGITQKYHLDDEKHDITQDITAEAVCADYLRREGVTLNHVNGDRAYYSPALDTVVLPLVEQFKSSSEYYSTLFHELAHSTGHESRLNRLSGVAAFGDDNYSTEELTAEICSASVLATLGIDTEGTLRNSAAYVQNWIKALKNDKKMIVVAAARAEKALKMLLDIDSIQRMDDAESADENKNDAEQPATVQASAPEMQTLYSAPEKLINSLEIRHPTGVMRFFDLRSFFPMSQKDLRTVLPIMRYLDAETLERLVYTLRCYRAEEEQTANRASFIKRCTANVDMICKAFGVAA